MGKHFNDCQIKLTMDCASLLYIGTQSPIRLMNYEALFINELKPSLNTKDGYRSRVFIPMFYFHYGEKIKIGFEYCFVFRQESHHVES